MSNVKAEVLVRCFTNFKNGYLAHLVNLKSYSANSITAMSDLEYWFDGKKENHLNKLKVEFQNMMIQNGKLETGS